VLEAMQREASAMAPSESGGVLLGYWVHPRTEVVITDAVGPGPSAVHGAKDFLPDHEYQEREIAKRYEVSGRQISYLGDWHSHPGGTGSLSPSDEKTLRRIAEAPAARSPMPLMAVLAGGEPWQIAVWCGELRRILVFGIRLATYRLDARPYDR
jgi:integrative and conjugative element protein (TIGR02256 family)